MRKKLIKLELAAACGDWVSLKVDSQEAAMDYALEKAKAFLADCEEVKTVVEARWELARAQLRNSLPGA